MRCVTCESEYATSVRRARLSYIYEILDQEDRRRYLGYGIVIVMTIGGFVVGGLLCKFLRLRWSFGALNLALGGYFAGEDAAEAYREVAPFSDASMRETFLAECSAAVTLIELV